MTKFKKNVLYMYFKKTYKLDFAGLYNISLVLYKSNKVLFLFRVIFFFETQQNQIKVQIFCNLNYVYTTDIIYNRGSTNGS